MRPGILLISILITAVLFGCAKKKVRDDKEFSQTTKNSVQGKTSESTDIFDEFYKDEQVPAEPAPVKNSEKKKVTEKKTASSFEQSSEIQFSSHGRYVIQISTMQTRSMADALAEKLTTKGYPAYVSEVDNPTPSLQGTFYRVRVGGFASISLARIFGESYMKPIGYDFWIDNKSNDNTGIEGYGFGSGAPASSTTTQSTIVPATTTPAPLAPSLPAEPTPSSPTTNSNLLDENW
jgi:hypothetical protein